MEFNWNLIGSNPIIFEFDYRRMKETRKKLHEELLEIVLNPDRLFKLIKEYDKSEIFKVYFSPVI